MNYAYVTFFNKPRVSLKRVEEWLIRENERIQLLELFEYKDFIKYTDYEHTALRTAFISGLSATKKALFFKILDKIGVGSRNGLQSTLRIKSIDLVCFNRDFKYYLDF
ncbi:hypothetical protein [Chryseobacterium fistulae]|uniref:Uncharacterized protein n=1 Tax=Chryseobacterium fistulae TaxID=2675058 RepID=A0A6N4Y037_9FLAO|nr:hypothetical protein [Chryseobacterium fistulae]CAA7392427.1 hypothetical protein CHRY9393_03147 [Chryseobacterium fistulae]